MKINVSNMLKGLASERTVILLAFILILHFISCGRIDNGSSPKVIDVNFKSENKSDTLYTSYLFSDVVYIPLKAEFVIGDVTDVRVTDNYIYVLDGHQRAVFQFDRSGCFLKRWFHHGRGPGEYVSLTAFDVNPHTGELSVLDVSSRKVLVYTSDDEFLYSFPFMDVPRDFAVLSNSEYVFYTPDYMQGVRHGIWKTDAKGNFIEDVLTIPESFKYSGGLKEKYFRHMGDTIYVAGSEYSNDLYHIASDSFQTPYHLNVDLRMPKSASRTSLPVLDKHVGQVYTVLMYYETIDWLMLQISDLKKPVVVLYDKDMDKCYYYSDPEDIVDDMPYSGVFISTTEDAVVGVIYPEMVLAYPQLKEQFPQVSEQSNPIIALSYTR